MTLPPQQQQAPPPPGNKPPLVITTHAACVHEKDKTKTQAGYGITFGLPELERLNVGEKVPKKFEQRSDALSRALALAPSGYNIHLTTSDDLTGFTIMLLTKEVETEKAKVGANGNPSPHPWPSSLHPDEIVAHADAIRGVFEEIKKRKEEEGCEVKGARSRVRGQGCEVKVDAGLGLGRAWWRLQEKARSLAAAARTEVFSFPKKANFDLRCPVVGAAGTASKE